MLDDNAIHFQNILHTSCIYYFFLEPNLIHATSVCLVSDNNLILVKKLDFLQNG